LRITVIGPGAVGLLWASRLAQAGQEVALLDHWPGRAARLSQEGVVLEDDQGSQRLSLPATAQPDILGQTELALVCVKAYHTAEVAAVLGQHLSPEGRALTLQNGAGNVEALAAELGPERVLGGITSEGATRLAEAHVRHAGRGRTYLGPAEGEVDDFTRAAAHALTKAGFDAEAVGGVQNLIWTKLVINAAINPLTALLDVPNGRLLELAGARELMETVVAEAVETGRALGVEFLHEDMGKAVREVAAATRENISSMLADVRAGRPTEVGFINGAVADQARQCGGAAPANRALELLVRAREENRELA
jgi:2-dehydropantoate 2-reductase